MARLTYKIRRENGEWVVRYGHREDRDLTDAVRAGFGVTSETTRRKTARFMERYFNFEHSPGEPSDAFISEHVLVAQTRVDAFLVAQGYVIIHETDRPDGSVYVRRKGAGSVSSLPCELKALSRLYSRLARKRLRSFANPMKVDNWHMMTLNARAELAELVQGKKNEHYNYCGSQYVASGLSPSPIRLENPSGLQETMLIAGAARAWPPAIRDLIATMGTDGPRWTDASHLTAADWARASRYGRTVWAPNKASKGHRVRKIVITAELVSQIRQSFDDDPARPSMDELEALLAAGNWEALEAIFLFPSKTGRPHSYNVFNNDYVRPAMEQGNVVIHSAIGSVRPTAHRLRAARIQEEATHIYRDGRSDEQIKADEAQLQRDMHIKSKKAFARYLGGLRQERADRLSASRQDERFARRKATHATVFTTIAPAAISTSRAQQRLAKLRKKP